MDRWGRESHVVFGLGGGVGGGGEGGEEGVVRSWGKWGRGMGLGRGGGGGEVMGEVVAWYTCFFLFVELPGS